MDADSSYGGSDTAQDSHSAHELSTASSLSADPHPHEKLTTAVHVIGPPAPDDQPPRQFYHKNEITVPVNVDQTDFQRSPRLPHYLATAKLNIGESLEHHSNLEEMSRNYRSSSRLNETPCDDGAGEELGGIENPAFADEGMPPHPGPVKSTFKPYNGDLHHDKTHGRDASCLNKNEEPLTEAVNLELINLKPVGQNQKKNRSASEPYDVGNGMTTIPLKKETDRDIGNPYDEYFVPVNEHRKYMRGEKLYVTKDNRVEKSRSKYICWIICVCLAVAALIIGILAAVGVIGNQGPLPQEVSARSFDGNQTPISKGSIGLPGVSDSGQPPSSPEPPISTLPAFLPTTDTSRIEVPRAIESELRIDNLQFNSELADTNSSEFKALAETLEKQIKNSLFNNNLLQYGPADIEVKVMEFESGSVIVKYRIAWKFKEGIHSAKDPIDPISLKRKLSESLQKNNDLMGTFHIPENSLSAGKILDRCKIENDGCEHVCIFDYDLVDFACLCPDGKRLSHDGKTCIAMDSVPLEPEIRNFGNEGPTDHPFLRAEEESHARHNFNDYEIPAEVEPEPSVEPEPAAKPEPSAEPEPIAEPKPVSEPEPTKKSDTEAEPSAEPEPEPVAEPEPIAEGKPSPEPEPTAEPQPEIKSEMAEVIPAAEPEPQPTAEPEPQPSAEPEPPSTPEPSPSAEPVPSSEPTHGQSENMYLDVANKNIESTTYTELNKHHLQNSSDASMKETVAEHESTADRSIEGLEQSTHEHIIMAVTPEHTTEFTSDSENPMQTSISPVEIPQNDFYYDSSIGLQKEQNKTENHTEKQEEHLFLQEENVSHKNMLDMGPDELDQAMHELGLIRVVTPVAEVITTQSTADRSYHRVTENSIGITVVPEVENTPASTSSRLMENSTSVPSIVTPVTDVMTTHSTADSDHRIVENAIETVVTPVAEVITTQTTVHSNQSNYLAVDNSNGVTNANNSTINVIQTQEIQIQNSSSVKETVATTEANDISFSEISREPKIQELHMYHVNNQVANHTVDILEHPENAHDEYNMSPFLPELENDTFINSLHYDEHFFDHNSVGESHENISVTKPPTLEFDQLNHTNPFDNNTSDALGVAPLESGNMDIIFGEETTTDLTTTVETISDKQDTTTKVENVVTETNTIVSQNETTTDVPTMEASMETETENTTSTEKIMSSDKVIETGQGMSTEAIAEVTTTQIDTNEHHANPVTEIVGTTINSHVIIDGETTTQGGFDEISTIMNTSDAKNDTEMHQTENSGDMNPTESNSKQLEETSTIPASIGITTLPSDILNNIHSNSFFDRHAEMGRNGSQNENPDWTSTTKMNNFNDLSSSTEDLLALETTTNIFRTRYENKHNNNTEMPNETATINAEVIETATTIVNFNEQETNEISTASSSPSSVYQVEEKVADFTTTEKLFVSPKPTSEISLEEGGEEDLSVVPLSEYSRDAFNEISDDNTRETRISDQQVNKVHVPDEHAKEVPIIQDVSSQENAAKPVTEDFDLPKFTRCRIGQFQCVNGTSVKDGNYCIASSDRCDSILDCSDGSDEVNCEAEGCPNNFQCTSKQCLKRHLVCDGILNCNDGTDEIDCDKWTCKFDEMSCGPLQRCIPISWKCDGKSHCLDGSDEHNCHPNSCSDESFHCSEQGSCISASWRCDGKQDCAMGEDEKLCDCSNDQFKCEIGGGCIPKTNRCDGIEHCADKSDEWNCLRLEVITNNSSNEISAKKILQVQAENSTWYPICMDWALWNTTYADLACQSLGYTGSTSLESVPKPEEVESNEIYQLKSSHDNTLQLEKKTDGECSQFTSINCQEYVCGSPSTFDLPSARIVGGNKAAPSQWPSLGLLYDKKRNMYCTSTLVTPLWAIASYSCVFANTQTTIGTDWILYAGGSNKTDSTSMQIRAVQKIVAHPQAKFSQFEFVNDVVLLKLRKPMIINVNVSASCLPQKDMEPRQLCIVSGWGVNQPGELAIQQYLHYLPVPMIDVDECNSTRHYNGKLSDDKMCAGYTDSEKTPCFNDEGAPLMCFSEETSNWELQGILSHHDNCGSNRHPAVYTKIGSSMRLWIANTIGRQALSKL